MKFHWKVLLWMLAGAACGLALQRGLETPAWTGADWKDAPAGGAELVAVQSGSPAAKGKLAVGEVATAVLLDRGTPDERRVPVSGASDVAGVLASLGNGDLVWFVFASGDERMVSLGIHPDSKLARILFPIDFLADIFMSLLRMLIVPIVFTSIVTGVSGVGSMKALRRLGGKTFAYYITTSLLAIGVGQILVSVFRPGDGARLGLSGIEPGAVGGDTSFVGFLRRMVPENVFGALNDNGAMLSIIFFALLFGFFLTRTEEPHAKRVRNLFESLFQVVLRMAEGIMLLLPYGVFCLLVRVVAKTGFGVFEPLLVYMGVVALALVIHACVTLPLIIAFVGRMSPVRWVKAMAPALMTAFSTSSSSLTLPVTLETVEKRGRVSNKVTSFTLPLGATINMDGTALYECIGVIFLAQFYGSTGGFELTFAVQAQVVVMALLASIGAAGIPSAGLVMMLTILAALDLPLEGAALLLAVDRPLDMMRTVVNVWSDSCGAAVIARTEGEEGPLEAGNPA